MAADAADASLAVSGLLYAGTKSTAMSRSGALWKASARAQAEA
jgi:hypothetical protein